MRMNPSIILQGQQPDIVGGMARGFQAGRQNALAQLYQQHGEGIASGDQNALNALARFDPNAALGVKDARQSMDARALGMDQTRLNMRATREMMDQRREQARMQAEQYAAGLSAAEAAKQAARFDEGIKGGIRFHQAGDLDGLNAHLQQFGVEPITSLDEFYGVAATAKGVLDALQDIKTLQGGPKPADEYGRYAQEERAAGRQPLTRIEYAQAKKGEEVIYGPDGQPILRRGPAGSGGNLNELQSKNATFATRARGALSVLDQSTEEGPLANEMTSRTNRVLDAVPLGVGREFQGSEYQVAAAAGQEFLQAILRKDTGAAITSQEQILYGQLYLPQPGDTPEVLEYRRQARDRAVSAIEAGMTPEAIRAQEIALAKESGVSVLGGDGQQPAQQPAPQTDIPPVPQDVPEGIDPKDWPAMWPAIWDAMSDEDKALFQ